MDRYLTDTVKLSKQQRQQLLKGEAVAKLLSGDGSKEIGVFGGIWIDAPIDRYIEAVQDIETFERGGGFKATKRLSDPPRLSDFAALRLPDDDIEDMRSCRVGDCVLKLGEQGIQRFRTEVDWKGANVRAAADQLMRELALQYATAYLEGGNDRLAVYRDNSRPTFVAREFREMTEQLPELTIHLPDVRQYLLDFPHRQLPDATSFLYWQETQFGLRPTIRINHVVIQRANDDAVVASKMLYASHYFWTGIELRALLRDAERGPGFWLISVSRSRSDGLSGLTGVIIRPKVRGEVQEGMLATLRSTKQRLTTP